VPVSRFFEVLPLLRDHHDNQVGLCVMGPVGAGDNLVWMSAWAWQQDGDNIAASTGDAGIHIHGAHPLKEKNKPPFKAPGKPTWMVQTGFRTGSADYNPEKPVLVQAMALLEVEGQRAIFQWSQAVMIRHGYHEPVHDDPQFAHQHGPPE
jgi:hypothetical protein